MEKMKMVGKMISGCDRTLEKIFCSDYEFEIPSYQRPYAWGVTQAQELFDDLSSFLEHSDETEGYFLGSIVLIKDEGHPQAQVVDGQQRLTTLTILFAVIASLMDGDCKEDCWGFIREKGSIVHQLAARPRLKLRKRDDDFFRQYVEELKDASRGKSGAADEVEEFRGAELRIRCQERGLLQEQEGNLLIRAYDLGA